MTDQELIEGLEQLRDLLISVATGGPSVKDVDGRYQQMLASAATELERRGVENPVPFLSLWDWYGRWSSGDLPTWQSRRVFVGELLNPLIHTVRMGLQALPPPTGWQRVDRCVGELRQRLATAANEEQYQAIGLVGREALISVAQAVFDRGSHRTVDGVEPSPTDAKRMLEAYITAELPGGGNEEARRHARSALDFAIALQHRRTATFREAALCVEAITSVVNVVAIVAGRRDPQ